MRRGEGDGEDWEEGEEELHLEGDKEENETSSWRKYTRVGEVRLDFLSFSFSLSLSLANAYVLGIHSHF